MLLTHPEHTWVGRKSTSSDNFIITLSLRWCAVRASLIAMQEHSQDAMLRCIHGLKRFVHVISLFSHCNGDMQVGWWSQSSNNTIEKNRSSPYDAIFKTSCLSAFDIFMENKAKNVQLIKPLWAISSDDTTPSAPFKINLKEIVLGWHGVSQSLFWIGWVNSIATISRRKSPCGPITTGDNDSSRVTVINCGDSPPAP